MEPVTRKEETIYQFEDVENPFFINELIATSDFLFWFNHSSLGRRLERFDLAAKRVKTIEENPDLSAPPCLLSTDGSYLAWYDQTEKENVKIMIYDIQAERKKIVADRVKIMSPYERVLVQQGIIAFNKQENGQNKIIAFHLGMEKEVATVELDVNKLRRIVANDNRIAFQIFDRQNENNSIYTYEYDKNELIEVNGHDGVYAFNYVMLDDYFLINDTGKIIVRNAEARAEVNITKDLPGEHSFILNKSTINGEYIALDAVSNHHSMIRVRFL